MSAKRIVGYLLSPVVVLSFSATAAMGGNILFISAMDEVTGPGDDALKAFIEGLGHTVTYFDDDESETDTEIAAAEADLVFISESVSSGRIREEITEIETPMIVTECWGWDEMGLTMGGGAGQNVTTADIEIVAPEHALAAGLSGTVPVLTDLESDRGPARFGNGIAGDEATIIARATLADGQTYDVVFIYEKGATLPVAPSDGSDQVAADIRVCLGFDEQSYLVWNENAYALLEAAINYVLGVTGKRALARNPSPADGASDVPQQVVLTWRPGAYVEGSSPKHRVFFSENFDEVNAGIGGAEQDVERYPINGTLSLDLGKTYYWRVDEPNSTIGWDVGDVWRFTIIDHLVVDDFEDYDAGTNEIWWSWRDGLGFVDLDSVFHPGNGTGSEVGDGTTPSFTEETIVHGGGKSMPYLYDNNKTDKAKYSEATKTLTETRDWAGQGLKALSLWFRGNPAFLGGFTEAPAGTYTMTAGGEDIEDESDQFHFAFKELSGPGEIIAKIESVQNTHAWAKAGVMIRDTLDADSAHAMVAVTPMSAVWFGSRTSTGNDTGTDSEGGITAPYWVKLERTLGGLARAYYSPDGNTWTQLGSSVSVAMTTPMYVGLALTSHSSGVACEAVFSNVTSDGTGQWINQDIGMNSNEAEPMYVAVANSAGTPAVVYHDDPNAALINTWTEWNIELKDFSDRGVDLTDVNSIAIGFGDRDNPQPGGSGMMYFDDIRLYQARCVLDKLTLPEADLNSDCVVNYADLEMMANDWLQSDYTVPATTPQPAISWWKFDNNTNDSAGSIHGTTYGNPTYEAGKLGQAISLDGDDYVDYGNPGVLNFGTADWTVSAWIKTTQSDVGTIFANGGDETGGIRYTLAVGEEGGSVTLTTDDNAEKRQAIAGTTVNDGDWHHVAGIRDGITLRVCVDWAADGTNTAPDGYDLSGTSQHNAYVGAITDHRASVLQKYFTGSIDDVQVYDYALSDIELIGAAGLTELYYPLTSPANISDEEPIDSKKVNFKDFAVLADAWLEELAWPER